VNLRTVGIQHENPSKEDLASVGSELVKAFADIGFVYVAGHGVQQCDIEAGFEVSERFFSKDLEEKLKFNKDILPAVGEDGKEVPPTFCGYDGVGTETLDAEAGRVEMRESYNVNNLETGFPDALVPAFKPAVSALLRQFQRLTLRILAALEGPLGVSDGTLLSAHSAVLDGPSQNVTTLRLLSYPPVPPNASSNIIRCGEHSDWGTITMLSQDELGGLEVKDSSDQWVAAAPIPGLILVNVGDILAMWTNGRLRATEHRVRVPDCERLQQKVRRSMAFFVHPDNDELITPLDGSPCDSPVTALQHVLRRLKDAY